MGDKRSGLRVGALRCPLNHQHRAASAKVDGGEMPNYGGAKQAFFPAIQYEDKSWGQSVMLAAPEC